MTFTGTVGSGQLIIIDPTIPPDSQGPTTYDGPAQSVVVAGGTLALQGDYKSGLVVLAFDTVVQAGGELWIKDAYAEADGVTVSSGGNVDDYGTVRNVVIESGGTLNVQGGAEGVHVLAGGSAGFYGLAYASGATAVVSGSVLKLTEAGKTYLFNLGGTTAGSYTVTNDGAGHTQINAVTAMAGAMAIMGGGAGGGAGGAVVSGGTSSSAFGSLAAPG